MDTLFLECVYININTDTKHKHTHTHGRSESPLTAGLRLAGLNSQEHLNILFSLWRNPFHPVKVEFLCIKKNKQKHNLALISSLPLSYSKF